MNFIFEIVIASLVFFPLCGFIFNSIRWKSSSVSLSGVVASLMSGLSFISSLILFFALINSSEESFSVELFHWIEVGSFSIPFRFILDPLSSVMALVITGVGTLIHIFSIGYMSHDKRPAKYFAYLNFFLFNMLILILADNLFLTFVGWEGVGLSSYLLIGFWFSDKEKAKAGMKAFITNRVGDVGFLLGLFLIFILFGTVNYAELNSDAGTLAPESWGLLSWATLFLFIGATGKSAQIPLFVWLPDAMAGPTPVSALIHAATMVTSGVYLIVRMSPVFALTPSVLFIIALVGVLTALVAAMIGMTQWDIKKILAYSTVSQLGYMFLAVGVGAFSTAMFHLITHAFFKALMFLGSGSVIHALNHEQDIRRMGGLKKTMPITHATFALGWLAIIGVPLFSGFFSKDEILAYSLLSPLGSATLWIIALFTAGLTAFYMTRMMSLTFWGTSRIPSKIQPHEGGLSMTVPLIVLSLFAVFSGVIGLPHFITAFLPGHTPHFLLEWLRPVIAFIPLPVLPLIIEIALIAGSLIWVFAMAFLAYLTYSKQKTFVRDVFASTIFYRMSFEKFKVDEVYNYYIVEPTVKIAKYLWVFVDTNFIDNITKWITKFIRDIGVIMSQLQTGFVRDYVFYFALGVIFITTYFLY